MLQLTLRLLVIPAIVLFVMMWFIIPVWFPKIKNKKLKKREELALERKEYLREKEQVLKIEEEINEQEDKIKEIEER